MKKIKSLFERDYEGNRQVIDSVVAGSEWVQGGEGIATRKFDGTAAMLKNGVLYKRYDVKKGRKPPTDPQAIPCEEKPNEHTGHWPWWIPVSGEPQDRYFLEADIEGLEDGTYELCGPKVNNNNERLNEHILIPHGKYTLNAPTQYNELKKWLHEQDIEGIVWHHKDGRMVKIKTKDFGLQWPIKDQQHKDQS